MSTQVADRLSDFTDRVSPMLVKELRQGLRAKAFVGVFLGLQISLALLLLIAVAAGSHGSSQIGNTISSIVFAFFAIAVLLIQPLRGTNSLSSEIRRNTIDLMVLTQLSAWRIVVGKWFAIFSQSILLFISIVPYLILRYFLGGMDLFAELLIMTLILALSATLTAITVGLSGANSVLLRGIIPLGGCITMIIAALSFLFENVGRFHRFIPLDSVETYITLGFMLVMGAYFAWSSLDLGASMIAPMAENRSTPRRLLQLAALIVVATLTLLIKDGSSSLHVMIFLLSIPALIAALTERNVLLPPQVSPFLRRKWLVAPFRWMLYPGWAPGVWFAALWVLICGVALLIDHKAIDLDEVAAHAILLGTLVFPAVVQRLFRKQDQNPFASYLVILLITMVVSLVVFAVSQSVPRSERSLFGIFSIIPSYQWFILESREWDKETVRSISLIFTTIYFGVLVLLSLTRIKEIQHVEHLSREHNEE